MTKVNSQQSNKKEDQATDHRIESLPARFHQTLDKWIDELHHYSYDQLCLQPGPARWSLGQVYAHLIEETDFYFQQSRMCLNHNVNASGKMSSEAESWFKNNSYPNQKLQGPPDLPVPHQPESKEQLQQELRSVKIAADLLAKELSLNTGNGKTKHPGHDYFSAGEWFQFAEMHLRHHFRQKEEIDNFIKETKQNTSR